MTTTTEKTSHESTLIDRFYKRLSLSPLYVIDIDKIVATAKSLEESFKSVYENFKIGYSFKTNSTPRICNALINNGIMAEIVSPKEYELASYLTSGNNIIYNGVISDPKGKFLVALPGGIVNVDNYQEFAELEETARFAQAYIKLGIRLNFDIGAGYVSRFGVEYGGEEYKKILDLAEKSDFVSINGIHCHFHGGRSLECWKRRAETMIAIGKELKVEYIDLGGNMYGDMDPRLKEQFDLVPSFDDYAKLIGTMFNEAFENDPQKPMLIIEAGTPIVANGVSFYTVVDSIKKIGNRYLATLNGSIYNLGFFSKGKKCPIDVYNINESSTSQKYDLYGYTCTEGDLMFEGYEGPLAVGDVVAFRNVGAYSMELCSKFIKDPPEGIVLQKGK